MPELFNCPNMPVAGNRTNYLAVSGPGTAFPGNQKVTIRSISDGLANTAAFVEADFSQAVEWTRPVDWKADQPDPLNGLGGIRPGIFLSSFCDGSTHSISSSIDPKVWQQLLTIDEEK